jgi:hypothetical protein
VHHGLFHSVPFLVGIVFIRRRDFQYSASPVGGAVDRAALAAEVLEAVAHYGIDSFRAGAGQFWGHLGIFRPIILADSYICNTVPPAACTKEAFVSIHLAVLHWCNPARARQHSLLVVGAITAKDSTLLSNSWFWRRRSMKNGKRVPKTKVERVKLVKIAKARKKLERAEYIY